jgi:beta-galactosidase
LRAGLPDQPAFNDDLYRRVGHGKAWIMEQQPGPVNWAAYNQAPQDGMVRLWTWLAFAHGLDVVCYFRWRQSKFAQEQFHAGLMLPNNKPDQAFHEVKQVAEEIKKLPQIEVRQQAEVALVLDYTSRWAAEVLPQGADYSSARIGMGWYSAFMQRGVEVDIVSPDDALDGYRLVIVPDMIIDHEKLAASLNNCDAKVFLGARTGSKTPNMHIPDHLPPGSFAQLIDVQVERVESLPAYNSDQIEFDGENYPVGHWREHISTTAPVLARFKSAYRDDAPALIGNEKCWYAALPFEGEAQAALVDRLIGWADVNASTMQLGLVRYATRGSLKFAFNFSDLPQKIDAPEGVDFFVGDRMLTPRGVAIWSARR